MTEQLNFNDAKVTRIDCGAMFHNSGDTLYVNIENKGYRKSFTLNAEETEEIKNHIKQIVFNKMCKANESVMPLDKLESFVDAPPYRR